MSLLARCPGIHAISLDGSFYLSDFSAMAGYSCRMSDSRWSDDNTRHVYEIRL